MAPEKQGLIKHWRRSPNSAPPDQLLGRIRRCYSTLAMASRAARSRDARDLKSRISKRCAGSSPAPANYLRRVFRSLPKPVPTPFLVNATWIVAVGPWADAAAIPDSKAGQEMPNRPSLAQDLFEQLKAHPGHPDSAAYAKAMVNAMPPVFETEYLEFKAGHAHGGGSHPD
jgi:hypothetical protein